MPRDRSSTPRTRTRRGGEKAGRLVREVVDALNERVPPGLRENLRLMHALEAVDASKLRTADAPPRALKAASKPSRREAPTTAVPPQDDELAEHIMAMTPQQREVALLLARTKEELALQCYELLDLCVSRTDRRLVKLVKEGHAVAWREGTEFEDALVARSSSQSTTTSRETHTRSSDRRQRRRDHEMPLSSSSGAKRPRRSVPALNYSESRLAAGAPPPPPSSSQGGGDSSSPRRHSSGSRSRVSPARKLSLGSQLNMDVDPNEPVYCVCNQVAFGEMVLCDNPDCSREWFHVQCIGGKPPSGGTWLCPDCRALPS